MSAQRELFGYINKTEPVYIYKIKNKNGMTACLQTLGAGIQSLFVPDRKGEFADVVLGFDSPADYTDPDNGYQGLCVGRWANRIRDAKFTFNGKDYSTPVNQGRWTLHSGGRFSFTNWKVVEAGDNFVVFSRFSPDGEDGFPGNFNINVKYTLTDSNALRIEYTILCDEDSVANVTNHSYFNLSGKKDGTIENHYLEIFADDFTETDDDQLPTGEISPVKGTMMDFTYLHKIGDKIDVPFRAVIDGVGYDNNYCLRNKSGKLDRAAVLEDKESGRRMEVYTDLPGIQLYCGGWLDKNNTSGKAGSPVSYRRGVALETQFYPDTLHFQNKFPFRCVKANEKFNTITEFRFSVDE